jgi:hypothetical protein
MSTPSAWALKNNEKYDIRAGTYLRILQLLSPFADPI